MNVTFDLFLTDTETITEVMSDSANTLRVNNVSYEDVHTFCELASKYGFTVAAFLGVDED